MTDISTEAFLNANASRVGGYNISNTETGSTSYYGYIDKDGGWYIQKAVVAGAATTYTYAKGDSGYDWANKATATYGRFDTIFG